MANFTNVWIFSEKQGLLFELVTGAKRLAGGSGRVTAVVLGTHDQAREAVQAGADRAVWLGEQPADRLVDDYVDTIDALLQQDMPDAFLFGATMRGKAVAGRIAARLNSTVITDVKEIALEGEEVRARHMIFGGGAVRVEKPLTRPVLLSAGAGTFQPMANDPDRQGEIVEAPFLEPAWRATLCERQPRRAASVNLAAARKVVCPGRGVARQDDLAMITELAQALGAEVACTRPLAEGLGWLPRERYIGISGAQIKPDLYLGVGVSGQVQHTVGMSEARVVVAINKDQNAPIFSQADYGVVGDLYQVVPALIRALKARS